MVVLSVTSGLLLTALYFNSSSCIAPLGNQETELQAESLTGNQSNCMNFAEPVMLTESYDSSSLSDPQFQWKATEKQQESFWDNWARQFDSPFVSSNTSSSFYGLGVWMPEKFAEDDILDVEEVKELIKKYGLQMSFGIGGENRKSPRLRFDYRWHEDRDLEDVFIQVEIPFQ